MTGAAFLLLTLTLVVAAADWLAVARRHRLGEYVCKPLTIVLLIGVVLSLDPHDHGARALFVVALLLSLAGDIFLMVERDLFTLGLGAFLLAHLAYVTGMLAEGVGPWGLLLGALLVAGSILVVGTRIVAGVQATEPDQLVPVVIYLGVISAMVAAACGVGRPLGVVGAGLFYASDALIGWSRFVRPQADLRLVIIVTYHLGQIGLALSLV